MSLTCFCGVVTFAKYHDCDLLSRPVGKVEKQEQILPYYVMEVLGPLHGLPGSMNKINPQVFLDL